MNANAILCWGIACCTVGSAVMLVTAWSIRRLRYASVRHLAWLAGFACVGALPLLPVADWIVQRERANAGTAEALNTGVDATEARACTAAPARGVSGHPLTWLALGVWFTGAACTLGRAMLALRTVDLWRRGSVEYRLPASLPVSRFRKVAIRIAREEAPEVPITFGLGRPIVLLPRSAELWDVSRITAVVWHELGHIRRRDNLSQLFVLSICALHWFNPVFWFAARRMEAEAEMAADDFAILRGLRPSRYAAELLAVASELRSGAWRFPTAHTAMVKPFTLETRLLSIIDPKSQRGIPPVHTYLRMAGAFAGLVIVLIVLTPRLASWLESRTAAAAPGCLPTTETTF